MAILIFALIVLIVCALVVFVVRTIGVGEPFDKLIVALVVIIAIVVICQRAGLI